MIFLLGLITAVSCLFLPWWCLILMSLVFGFLFPARWVNALIFGVIVGIVHSTYAYFLDSQGLIASRVAGPFMISPKIIPVIPGVLGLLISSIYLRLGSGLRSFMPRFR